MNVFLQLRSAPIPNHHHHHHHHHDCFGKTLIQNIAMKSSSWFCSAGTWPRGLCGLSSWKSSFSSSQLCSPWWQSSSSLSSSSSSQWSGGDSRLADPFLLPHARIRRPLIHGQRHVPGPPPPHHHHHRHHRHHHLHYHPYHYHPHHLDHHHHPNYLTTEHCVRTGSPPSLPLHWCRCPWIGEYHIAIQLLGSSMNILSLSNSPDWLVTKSPKICVVC